MRRLSLRPEMGENELTGSEAEAPFVELRTIWKRFPGVVANRDVDLTLRRGEVHALLGENGAGKTTLMNILSGSYRPDAGQILLDGRSVHFRGPADAIAAGVGMVHQHFRLVEKLTAAENMHLGWPETPWGISLSTLAERTQRISAQFGLEIVPEAKIWQLSTGEQQRVEILRVLARDAKLLILDEPTAVLTPIETGELFRIIRSLAESGRTIVFISHKLDEVLEISDRVTVLREGRVAGTSLTSECTQRSLARLMVGEEVIFRPKRKRKVQGAVLLRMRHVEARNDRGLPALHDVNLDIREGEIVGIAGVAGNGQRELAEVITGLRRVTSGDLVLDERDLNMTSPSKMARMGVGHIPEDRLGMGLIPGESVTHNAILREYARPPLSVGVRIDNQAASRFARNLVRDADVRVASVRSPVRNLSGGNQQRLLAARETRIASKLLVAVHPTRGLDISATESLRSSIVDHRNRGSGVLLISEDLDEVLLLADRILVMYEGRIVGEFDADHVDREVIGLLMGGVRSSERDG